MTFPAAIRLLTPRGLFRRVEDGWSPRKEILLDKDTAAARRLVEARSPVRLPTHEILSHALVWPVHRIQTEHDGALTTPVLLPVGTSVLYEWLGPSDGYAELSRYFETIRDPSNGTLWSADRVLKTDAEQVLGLRHKNALPHDSLIVTYAGPAFQE